MRRLLSVFLIAGVALCACASPRKADVRLPQGFEAPQPTGAAVALESWWTAFNDPELTTLIDQALAANPDVRRAAAVLKEARAVRTSIFLQMLPQGDATGSYRKTHTDLLSGANANIPGFSTSGTSEAYSANFNVSWEVDLFGRLLNAGRSASADLAAARFAYEGARATLAAQVADAYFEARGLAIQLEDARESARISRSLYDIANKRGQIGIAATSEADRVAGDLAQADAQAAALEAELQVQKRTLLVLAGRIVEPTTNIDAPPSVGAIPAVPATIPSELLQRRPDVREAQSRVTSAIGRLRGAQLAIFPIFTLTPGLGWAKNTQPGYSAETQSWSLGGTVVQPVLNIPHLLADAKAEGARTEQTVIAYEKVVQTAFSESEAALVRLDADRRRVALLTDGEARAERAYRAAKIGYDRGFTDLQTTLSTEQSWRATRAQLTAAEVQGLRRAVQAYKALGGGWPAQDYPRKPQARREITG